MTKVTFLAMGCLLLACKRDSDSAPSAASASASASARVAPSAAPSASVIADLPHEPWWAVAMKGKVTSEAERTRIENATRALGSFTTPVNSALNGIAKEPATAAGFRAAVEEAQRALPSLVDVSFGGSGPPPSITAFCEAAIVVLAGIVAQACTDHPDVASSSALMKAIREAHYPRASAYPTDTPGAAERRVLEQEMSLSLDGKVWVEVEAKAPPPKKWPR